MPYSWLIFIALRKMCIRDSVKACSVYDWCRFTKSDAVKNLMIHILMEELEVEKPAQKVDQSLKGLTFVITRCV